MPFDWNNFRHVWGSAATGGHRMFSYKDLTATLADIDTAGFFNPLNGYVAVGDWLAVTASDGGGAARFTSVAAGAVDITDVLTFDTATATYNGFAVLGVALLPAGTTGDHNGQPVIGVRNVNEWPPSDPDVRGVDVLTGGLYDKPYILSMNVNHQLAQGYGYGYHTCDLVKAAWQIRPQNGHLVDQYDMPSVDTGWPKHVLIECPRWADALNEPMHGDFYLITDGAFDVEVLQKDAASPFGQPFATGVISLDGTVTDTQHLVTVPSYGAPCYLALRIRNVSVKPTKIQFVHSRHLTDHLGGAYLSTDLIDNYILPLKPFGGYPIYRTMKMTKTNAHHAAYPAASLDKNNLSYHSGFVDIGAVTNRRQWLNYSGGAPTHVVGETVTQAVTGATGLIVNVAAETTANRIVLQPTTGTFDSTNELTGDQTGAMGPASVPTSTFLFVPAEHATPYEVLLKDAAYYHSIGKTYIPWICIHPNISDTDFDAFCGHMQTALAAGVPEIYVEFGNERWLLKGSLPGDTVGINSSNWYRDEGVALWGSGTMYGTTADIGRQYAAKLDMYFYDRMRAILTIGELAKVILNACDQPGYIAGLDAYLGRDANNPWGVWATAQGGAELALYNEWADPATNPIGNYSYATYFGKGQNISDPTDLVEVEANLRADIAATTSLIGGSHNYIRAVIDANKATPTRKISYEGGPSIYFQPVHPYLNDPIMTDIWFDALDAYRAIGSEGTVVYADSGPLPGSNGDWNAGIDWINGLESRPYHGGALIDYNDREYARFTPATGNHNGGSVLGVVVIEDGATTYNGQPVIPINVLTGTAGAGGDPLVFGTPFVYLIDSNDTEVPLPPHNVGDMIVVGAGVDRGENSDSGTWFGVDVDDTSWTKVRNQASGSDQYRTENWLWVKVATASEPLPTLHLPNSPPVDQHGQVIVAVLRNVNTVHDYSGSLNTSNGAATVNWTNVAGVDMDADNSVMLFLGTDRQPDQNFTITQDSDPTKSVSMLINGGSGSLGPTCTTVMGSFKPGAAGPTGTFTVNWSRTYYRPSCIIASFSKV